MEKTMPEWTLESKNSFCLTRYTHLERSFFPPFREHLSFSPQTGGCWGVWRLHLIEKPITCMSCYWDVPCLTLPTKICVLLILLAWEMVAMGRLGYPCPCQPWFIMDNSLGWWKPHFVAGRRFSIPCVQAGTTRQRQLQKQSWRAELWLCFSLWCQALLISGGTDSATVASNNIQKSFMAYTDLTVSLL